MASRTSGAVTVENVGLRDFVDFAKCFDFGAADAFSKIASFSGDVMTNVGAPDLIARVGSLQKGTARKAASDTEQVALACCANPPRRHRPI